MPTKVGEGVLELSVDDSGLDKGLAAGEKKSASWLKKLAGGVAKTLAVGVVGAGAAVGGVGVTLGKLALDALPLEGISEAFKGITGDAGETMAALREGSLGMVRDTELMASYNTAAGLVSKTFADELPEAMGYLTKVAAATGEDMGYMIDSLVKGVGRMSPMILDNLGIQVALSDAVAKASEMFGVEADELTKTQQQAGMMAVVMEKLQENTAAMPEVTGTAAQMWASLRTTLANVKDQIGMELIPVFKPLIGVVGDLARDLLPKLIGFIRDRVIPGIRDFAGIVGEWGQRFKTDVLPVLRDIWDWLREKIPEAIRTASEYWQNTLRPAIETVCAFIQENLEPILGALAGVLLGVVIPAIIAWATTMWTVTIPTIAATVLAAAPIILILAAIGAAVGLLVKAWQEDWGGIRTTLTEFWEEKAKPIFDLIVHWFKEVLPPALLALRDWFVTAWTNITTTVSDAWNAAVAIFQSIKLWFTVTMPNALRQAWEDVKTTVRVALAAVTQRILDALTWLSNFWQETWDSVINFFRAVWDTLRLILLTALILILDLFGINLEDLLEKWRTTWDAVSTKVTEIWATIKSTVREAAQAVYDFVKGQLDNIWDSWTLAWGLVSGKATEIWEAVKGVVRAAAEAVWGYIETQLGYIQNGWNIIWDALSTKASEIWETIKTTVGDAAKAVWTILTGWYEDIKAAVTDPLTDAWQAIKDKIGEWVQMGKDILEGLISGAKEKAQALIDSVLGPIKDAIGRAKKLLGMSSPSRLFAEMGRGMMEGMALGVQQYAAVPAAAMALATQQVITTTETHYHLQYYGAHETQTNIRDIIRSLEIGSR